MAALATTGIALSSRDATRSSDDRGVTGQNDGCVWKIAALGAWSGGYATWGEPIVDAAAFAVEEAGERADLACRVELRAEDSQGKPNVAKTLAREVVEDEAVVACLCPYFTFETLASGPVFSSAGVLMTGTATNETLDEQGFETWFGAVASTTSRVRSPARSSRAPGRPTSRSSTTARSTRGRSPRRSKGLSATGSEACSRSLSGAVTTRGSSVRSRAWNRTSSSSAVMPPMPAP